MNICLIVLLLTIIQSTIVKGLIPFDPSVSDDSVCKPSMNKCSFYLEADALITMFYKQLYRVIADDNGILHKYDNSSKTFYYENILTGDGYPKLVYVFNNSFPGPVLNVYQGQNISIEIFNSLPTETLSVHFHGIRQVGTPKSDGIGRVTQLSILPFSSFVHSFIATDQGTYWYHSHVPSQTAMGLLGAFIVHPKVSTTNVIKEFTVVLHDWQHFYTSEQHQLLVASGQFFPNSIESIMTSGTIDYFQAVDGSRSAEALVTSILINGRGQYFDPRNNQSSTAPFERLYIDPSPSQYRIRLINGGSTFSLVFSIDEHQLEVISSDGIPFAKSVIVDQIVVGLGERYDLLVNVTPTLTQTSWWIRVNTMDKNNNPRWHAKAILQVGNDTLIKPMTNPRNCSLNSCYVLNCPFTQYGSNRNIICLTLQNVTSDLNYIDKDLLSNKTEITIKKSLSLTMVDNTDEETGYESLNYLSMRYPLMDKPILYEPKLAREKLPCSHSNHKMMKMTGEKCYNNIVAKYDDIIEFLIVNFDGDQHPMHLHGSFFLVIEQDFPQLDKTTGLFIGNNPNVKCDDQQINCHCVNCTINTYLVKDTIILPSGGYMRIRFRANNPGVWLFHCHTEPHLDRGMSIMIHVAEDRIPSLLYSTGSIKLINNRFIRFIMFLLISINY